MSCPSPRQILAIDLLRFACALMVVAHHYAAMLPISPPAFAADSVTRLGIARDWASWSWAGWVGVEIFFVVSGYVIAISAAEGGGGAFLRRRALRLVPAAWICASITTLVALAVGLAPAAVILSRWCASLSFFPLAPQADPSSWTLGIEVSFYLLVAAVLRNRHNGARVEGIGLLLAIMSMTFWGLRLVGVVPPIAMRLLDLALFTHGAFFAIGIALWGVRSAVTPLRAAILVLALPAGCIEIVMQARFMSGGLGLGASSVLPLALFAVGLGLIVGAHRLQRPLDRLIGAKWLAAGGLATYPLYLLHQQTGFVMTVTLASLGVESHVAMILTASAAVCGAVWISRLPEPALRRWLAARIDALSRRGSRRDTPPSASLPAG